MAVRNPEGEIVLEDWDNVTKQRAKITKLPFFRGIFNLIDSMGLGYKCLMRSAEISGLEEAEAELAREKAEKKRKKAEKKAAKKGMTLPQDTEAVEEKDEEKKGSSAFTNGVMAISMVLGVALAVLLFIYLPTFLSTLILGKNAAIQPPEGSQLP